MTKKNITALILIIALAIAAMPFIRWVQGRAAGGPDTAGKNRVSTISPDEAMAMIEEDSSLVIVDVRRPEEFAQGHIPGAVNIPNEDIGDEMPEALPDLEQRILIYCRSGNRSAAAAKKLVDIGYEDIYDFGGIIDWTGDVVTE